MTDSDPSGLCGFSALSTAGQIADLAFVGAVGGAITTGTLRGALIGAAIAEAFWGVGGLKADLGIEAYNATGSSAASGAIVGAAGIGLHAAVGCASSAAGGGQCGSGAISGGSANSSPTQRRTCPVTPTFSPPSWASVEARGLH